MCKCFSYFMFIEFLFLLSAGKFTQFLLTTIRQNCKAFYTRLRSHYPLTSFAIAGSWFFRVNRNSFVWLQLFWLHIPQETVRNMAEYHMNQIQHQSNNRVQYKGQKVGQQLKYIYLPSYVVDW
ncbi:hypothetical protein FRX31_002543 [Thalictrum thalictroides]|uniref:Uncharacterized protein n=1 Tax=Thalictrum thalictroides TaxID=46969 RepID=A0A7J6XFU5_THATH|nr:hypothetical protein FRX31_002543 [Thalictrum thalictroides]